MAEEENNQQSRSPSPETVQNTVAIGKLTAISERTTKDVDRLVSHIEKILPVHEQIATMRKILYSSIALAFVFAAWITQDHFKLKEQFVSHIAVQIERTVNEKKNKKEEDEKNNNDKKEANIKIDKNQNQITWLKGSKMNKPKG